MGGQGRCPEPTEGAQRKTSPEEPSGGGARGGSAGSALSPGVPDVSVTATAAAAAVGGREEGTREENKRERGTRGQGAARTCFRAPQRWVSGCFSGGSSGGAAAARTARGRRAGAAGSRRSPAPAPSRERGGLRPPLSPPRPVGRGRQAAGRPSARLHLIPDARPARGRGFSRAGDGPPSFFCALH